jgi:hypothetical protein
MVLVSIRVSGSKVSCSEGETVRRGLPLTAAAAAAAVVMSFAAQPDDDGSTALVDALRALQGKRSGDSLCVSVRVLSWEWSIGKGRGLVAVVFEALSVKIEMEMSQPRGREAVENGQCCHRQGPPSIQQPYTFIDLPFRKFQGLCLLF